MNRPSRGCSFGGALVLTLTLMLAARAVAQGVPAPTAQPELRLDVIAGHQPAAQIGAGVQIPAGYYVRLGLDVAVGVALGDDRALNGSAAPATGRLDGRLDLLTRFLLDPFRQSGYGLSVGGGLSLRAEPGDGVRPLLLVAVDVEGRRSTHGVVPALQLGLGGGARVGVVLRRGARLTR